MCNVECDKLFGMNFIIFVSSKFRSNLFAANGTIIRKITKFDLEQKSSKFLLEITTLVSSANNICSDIEFLHSGCSLTYILNNRALKLLFGELHVWMFPGQRKKISLFWEILLQLFAFSQLNRNWTNLQIILELHRNVIR
jgi:hypothetical protein